MSIKKIGRVIEFVAVTTGACTRTRLRGGKLGEKGG